MGVVCGQFDLDLIVNLIDTLNLADDRLCHLLEIIRWHAAVQTRDSTLKDDRHISQYVIETFPQPALGQFTQLIWC